jgi:hypothetical protein
VHVRRSNALTERALDAAADDGNGNGDSNSKEIGEANGEIDKRVAQKESNEALDAVLANQVHAIVM